MSSILNRLKSSTSHGLATRKPQGKKSPIKNMLDHSPKVYDNYEDLKRIVNLPIARALNKDECEVVSEELIEARHFTEGFRFLDTQANAIFEFRQARGGFFPIGVGWGKTGVSLACANIAYTEMDAKVIVLLIPPNVTSQLREMDEVFWRTRIVMQYPVYYLAGANASKRKQLAHARRPGLYVMAYSQLSTKDAADTLDMLRPDCIIADEAHNIADRNSARSRRIYGHIDKHQPIFAAMSGTITDKSPVEYAKLARYALKNNNFLPNTMVLVKEWANLIDAAATKEGDFSMVGKAGAINPIVHWATKYSRQKYNFSPTGFRKAFQYRMSTCPGVYSSGDNEIKASLLISNITKKKDQLALYPEYDKVEDLAYDVEELWKTPNGDEIEYGIHKWKWLSEIKGAGFYNQLNWPNPEKLMKNRGYSEAQADDVIEHAKAHHVAGQHYARELRGYLQDRSMKNLDTPMLVGREFSLHGVSGALAREDTMYQMWREWKDLDFEGRPEREASAVRICDFKVAEALKWAQNLPKKEGGIIWYLNQEMGRWMSEYLRDAGMDYDFLPASKSSDERLVNYRNNPQKAKGKTLVASIMAHGTGKNIQFMSNALFLQWPRQAKQAEQTLGRLHRNGQEADCVNVFTMSMCEWDAMNFAATLNDALYTHQSTGNRQKLIYATYDPRPKIFPSHVLQQRGAEKVATLSTEMVKQLKLKFGEYSS